MSCFSSLVLPAGGTTNSAGFLCLFNYLSRKSNIMRFVKPTKEQRDFIPTPLAARENINKVGVGIIDQLISADFVRDADETKSLLEETVPEEFEPSAMNIVDQKLKTTGLDFKSFDPRVLRGE